MQLVCLYNATNQPEKTLEVLRNRRYHPWEGGKNPTLEYVQAHYLLGMQAMEQKDWSSALSHFEQALDYPANLRAGRLKPTPESHIHYYSGIALEELGSHEEALERFNKAAAGSEEFSSQAYYRVLALRRLGNDEVAKETFVSLLERATKQRDELYIVPFHEPYSADFVLFEDDIQERNRTECTYLVGLASLGLGNLMDAQRAFNEVIAVDPYHTGARVQLQLMCR
jgi:tetratricopeptide (TPR) repeat protein